MTYCWDIQQILLVQMHMESEVSAGHQHLMGFPTSWTTNKKAADTTSAMTVM